jgi:hypothetical protein
MNPTCTNAEKSTCDSVSTYISPELLHEEPIRDRTTGETWHRYILPNRNEAEKFIDDFNCALYAIGKVSVANINDMFDYKSSTYDHKNGWKDILTMSAITETINGGYEICLPKPISLIDSVPEKIDTNKFNSVVTEQLKRCTDVLIEKADEYEGNNDRLHNFRSSSHLQGCTLKQAIAGQLAKHTISVFDMCASKKDYPVAMWNEKITDNINYLLLLRAAVEEELQIKQNEEKQ